SFWLEFELLVDNSNGMETYYCKHCNTKYAKNASRLQSHLEKCISYQKKLIEYELINTLSSDNSTKKRRIQDELDYKYSESDQKALENLLARAFCSAGMSFNVIENEDIKAVFQKDIPWFKVPSRYCLSNTLLNQEHVRIKQLVESILNESEYLCITSDGWSNIHRLPWACQIVRSMKEILNYVRNYQISLATLRRLQMEVYNKHISLLLPGDTRWRSVFYSASNFLETKTAIPRMTLEDNIKISDEIKNKILSDNFWLNLKILCNFLSPFAIFLKKLQNDQPTLSTVYSELLIILSYKLDPQYQGKTLNPKKWDSIIEDELIRLVPSQDQENILSEYAEY
ncbi:18942_t:CDS:2, partial [Dentiscutata erythropus]